MKTYACCLSLLVVSGLAGTAAASSHREAPAIAQDPMADNTDVYTFISPNDPDKIVFVANSIPLLLPSSGPNFFSFADDVAYEICIDNDGDAFRDICYRWRFKSSVGNGATFLYNTGAVTSLSDPTLNVTQTYDLFRFDYDGGRVARQTIAEDVQVAPWNVGIRSFPDYQAVAQEAVYTDGEMSVFAGPRDEPFFVDLNVFDLLGVGGTPSTDGVNVMSLVLEVPIEDVAADGVRPASGESGPTSVLGVYARNLRRVVEIRRRRGPARQFGRFVQVSRLAVPLVNEVVIPLQDKDNYNRTSPHNDVANFGAYILDPELNGLLSAVLDIPCTPNPSDGRTDIVGLLSPNGTTAADLLRINITEGQSYDESAFPNGRALDDDVTDTLLTVICSGDFSVPVGDGVDENDLPFFDDFPYLASPASGNPDPCEELRRTKGLADDCDNGAGGSAGTGGTGGVGGTPGDDTDGDECCPAGYTFNSFASSIPRVFSPFGVDPDAKDACGGSEAPVRVFACNSNDDDGNGTTKFLFYTDELKTSQCFASCRVRDNGSVVDEYELQF